MVKMEVISMYSSNIERDPLLPNTNPVLENAPRTLPSVNSSKGLFCAIGNLPCNYLYDGIQPVGCKHCHSCDSW